MSTRREVAWWNRAILGRPHEVNASGEKRQTRDGPENVGSSVKIRDRRLLLEESVEGRREGETLVGDKSKRLQWFDEKTCERVEIDAAGADLGASEDVEAGNRG